jgi:acyl-CoA thioester hydrolase
LKGFKHKTQIQIRFKDIDALGHVNNANHLSYIELARINYFNEVVGTNINWAEDGIILAKVVMDYKMPMMFADNVFVYTKCSRIGNKSFDLDYVIVKDESGIETILAESKTVLVCFNYKSNNSMPMPDKWRKKFEEFENILD